MGMQNLGSADWREVKVGGKLSREQVEQMVADNKDLTGIKLNHLDLSGANLKGANLAGAKLRGVNLEGADLEDAFLPEADLRGANLRGVNLKGAELWKADLRDADLSDADLEGACLAFGCPGSMDYAKLKGANMWDACNLPDGYVDMYGAFRKWDDDDVCHLLGVKLVLSDGRCWWVPEDVTWMDPACENVGRRRIMWSDVDDNPMDHRWREINGHSLHAARVEHPLKLGEGRYWVIDR